MNIKETSLIGPDCRTVVVKRRAIVMIGVGVGGVKVLKC